MGTPNGSLRSRIAYYRRLLDTYVLGRESNLSFWHEAPAVRPDARFDELGPYYMTFEDKADYEGPFDEAGVPILDYGGDIGEQCNPIAITQYGLARYNRYLDTTDPTDEEAFLAQADWLVENLEEDDQDHRVWVHRFDWTYRDGLHAPWPSGLAQGQALSLLARAHEHTGDDRYRKTAEAAWPALVADVEEGGLTYRDGEDVWIEEYVVDPPSHILNGYLWALWGVHDHHLATEDPEVSAFFEACVGTLARNLDRYDTGWWSLYEINPHRLPMVASPFYHALHIVQLRITARMTGQDVFDRYAERWDAYRDERVKRVRALAQKAAFKLIHY